MVNLSENVDIFKGLVNAIDPSSSYYPEGAAYVCDNSRIDKNQLWHKQPVLANTSGSPNVRTVPGKSGNHFQEVTILGTHIIASGLTNADNLDVGSNGYGYFTKTGDYPQYWDGTNGSGSGDSGLARPGQTTYPSIAVSGTGARQEAGIYFYMATVYDSTRDIETLPTPAVEHWVDKRFDTSDQRVADVPVLSGITSSGNIIRWYRTTVTRIRKGDVIQLGNLVDLKFYYIGEVASGSSFSDYAHDSEITRPENLYSGRGSRPPSTGVDALGAYQNRMFYFVNDVAYYSSGGRPEEVAQSYTLKLRHDYSNGTWTTGTFKDQLAKGTADYTTLTRMPLLDTGIYAEAKMTIKELAGQNVVRAKEIGDRLWIWTSKITGYIKATANMEGFRFIKARDGVGLLPKTLALSPYGLFGADERGIWIIRKEFPERISDGIIDIDDSSKSTYCNPSYLAASFGYWSDELNEYHWSIQNSATPTYMQIAYQADRERFVGPYSMAITGGTNYSLDDDTECYLTGGKTPSLSSRTGAQTISFWLGQKSAMLVKQEIDIDIIYTSITTEQEVTISTYLNSLASETGANSKTDYAHDEDELAGKVKLTDSGRYLEITISIPSACTAPVSGIYYTAKGVARMERSLR